MTSPSRTGHTAHRTSRRHTALVRFLAALKNRSGLAYAKLAARTAVLESITTVSTSTLKRAVDPSAPVPQENVVAAFARACGATTEEERNALRLWRAARAEERGILATLRAPSLPNVRTPADLAAALAAAYERAGAPPRRLLQKRATTDDADGTLLLPLTTVWRITRREAHAATWPQCQAFLRGCRVHPRRMRPWHEAWKRAQTVAPVVPERAASAAADDRYDDHTALAPGLQVFAETALPRLQALVQGVSAEALAPGLEVFAERMAPVFRSLRWEARRNGGAPVSPPGDEPSRTFADSSSTVPTDNKGDHGGAADIQNGNRRARPGPYPALQGGRAR
ncbi:helix-turn-helix domain-containing protein [Streptomyces sp. NPDC001621]|uniref:helix-turn-helix domain-containing protein n=1 Tax=Streptomyces sp. NPDC001621 TaxID=3364594 RepID=UPI00367466D9